jgi:hypothetical protein
MTSGGTKEDPDGAQDAPDPVFEVVEDWVDSYFRPMFIRPLGGEFRWCPQWWRHSEAVTRLTALWRAWEVFRLEPATGIADWLRDHLDHQLPILLGPRGPFFQCDPREHLDGEPFAAEPADYEALDSGPGQPDPATGAQPHP